MVPTHCLVSIWFISVFPVRWFLPGAQPAVYFPVWDYYFIFDAISPERDRMRSTSISPPSALIVGHSNRRTDPAIPLAFP